MSVIDAVLNGQLAQQQIARAVADTENARSLTAERSQNAIIKALSMQQELAAMKAMSSVAPPQPMSVETAQAATQVVADSTNPASIVQQQVKRLRDQAAQYRTMASYTGLDPKFALDLRKEADKVDNEAATVSNTYLERRAKIAEQVANLAGAIDPQDPQSLPLVVSQIESVDPEAGKLLKGLDRDASGMPVWTPRNVKMMQTISGMATTQAQRWTRDHNLAVEQHNKDNLARQVERDAQQKANEDALRAQGRDNLAETKRYHDAEIADKAAGRVLQGQRNAILEEGLGIRANREANALETKTVTSLQNDPVIKTYDKFEKSYLSAKNVIDNMNNDAWLKSRSVSEPAVDAMMTDFRNMVNNYKSNLGAKWSAQDQSKYSSLLEKMQSFASTIGQGKKPPTRVMEDVAAEINRMYQDQNAMALKRTLQAREMVYNQGGDPNNIRSPASVERAIKSGRAKEWTAPDGSKFIIFEDNTKIPVYAGAKADGLRTKRGAQLLDAIVDGNN